MTWHVMMWHVMIYHVITCHKLKRRENIILLLKILQIAIFMLKSTSIMTWHAMTRGTMTSRLLTWYEKECLIVEYIKGATKLDSKISLKLILNWF